MGCEFVTRLRLRAKTTLIDGLLIEQCVEPYSELEGTRTPFPSVLADGQVDRREVPNVGTMENDPADRDVAMRALGDSAPATLICSVKLDSVEEGFFKHSGEALVVRAISRTRCSRARHDLFIQNATFVHGLRRSIRSSVPCALGRDL